MIILKTILICLFDNGPQLYIHIQANQKSRYKDI